MPEDFSNFDLTVSSPHFEDTQLESPVILLEKAQLVRAFYDLADAVMRGQKGEDTDDEDR